MKQYYAYDRRGDISGECAELGPIDAHSDADAVHMTGLFWRKLSADGHVRIACLDDGRNDIAAAPAPKVDLTKSPAILDTLRRVAPNAEFGMVAKADTAEVDNDFAPEMLVYVLVDGDEITDPFSSPCGRFATDSREYGLSAIAATIMQNHNTSVAPIAAPKVDLRKPVDLTKRPMSAFDAYAYLPEVRSNREIMEAVRASIAASRIPLRTEMSATDYLSRVAIENAMGDCL